MYIAICGKPGSGKTTLAAEIMKHISKNYNCIHIDYDKIGHKVLEYPEVKERLIEVFGNGLIKNNYIDLKNLERIILSSTENMKKFHEITFHYVDNDVKDQLFNIKNDKLTDKKNKTIIIIEWYLLEQCPIFDMCEIKILLDTPYDERKKRIMTRDNISSKLFDLREYAVDYFSSIIENGYDFVIHDDYSKNYKNSAKRILKLSKDIKDND